MRKAPIRMQKNCVSINSLAFYKWNRSPGPHHPLAARRSRISPSRRKSILQSEIHLQMHKLRSLQLRHRKLTLLMKFCHVRRGSRTAGKSTARAKNGRENVRKRDENVRESKTISCLEMTFAPVAKVLIRWPHSLFRSPRRAR